MSDPLTLARAIWDAGVAAVGGYEAVSSALDTDARPDRIVAVGKAAAAMTKAALEAYGEVPALVVTKYGHAEGLILGVEVIESAHPVPDAQSLAAGRRLREVVAEADGTLLLLVSGGASALAEDLVDGQALDDLSALNRRLLSIGLDITAMNAERRKLSRIKGGGLLSGFRGTSARVLAISDVPGDDLAVIGSGIGLPPEGDARFRAEIVASNAIAREAAALKARDQGITVLTEDEALHHNLDTLAAKWGPRIRDMEPGAIILGGEPTVVLPDDPGEGGRNQALALALAQYVKGTQGIAIVVGGTDGSDGPTGAAGGIVDGATWGDGAAEALIRADSGTYLDARGSRLVTGPTGTNVMDLLVAVRA